MCIKIGIISNFYPPKVYGGYEIGCGQVAEGLRSRGCSVHVLTSKGGAAGPEHVHKWLDTSVDRSLAGMRPLPKLAYVVRHERQNLEALRRFLREVEPDVLYLWNLGHTSGSLLAASLETNLPTGCFAFDYGLVESSADVWSDQVRKVNGSLMREGQTRVLRMAGKAIGRPELKRRPLDFIHYPTKHLRDYLTDGDFHPNEWLQVPWGVDTSHFVPGRERSGKRLLFVGQVAEHKGVHLAIEALAEVRHQFPESHLELTIAGNCMDPIYEAKLHRLVAERGLEESVSFLGFVTRDALPELFQRHGILIFPSIWDEPMGITVIEAMSCGLTVVISGTGGSGELIENARNGLCFRAGDSADLARQLASLLTSPDWCDSIAHAARTTAINKYDFESTLDAIEENLKRHSVKRDTV